MLQQGLCVPQTGKHSTQEQSAWNTRHSESDASSFQGHPQDTPAQQLFLNFLTAVPIPPSDMCADMRVCMCVRLQVRVLTISLVLTVTDL